MTSYILTHKGMLGLCPVYVTDPHDDKAPCAHYARHWLLVPLLWLSYGIFDFCFALMQLTGHEVGGYPVTVTGELDARIEVVYDDDDDEPQGGQLQPAV